MEEITLRFEIIRLAVELGDFETIDLQCRKLQSLSLDERLDEIIEMLESRNYRQALYGMKYYHQSLEDEFFEKKSDEKVSSEEEREKSEWSGDFFSLDEEGSQEGERVMDLDEILRLSAQEETVSNEETSALFDLSRSEAKRTEMPETERVSVAKRELCEKETKSENTEEVHSRENIVTESTREEISRKEREEPAVRDEDTTGSQRDSSAESGERPKHPPISYIGQKYRNMIHQFPPMERAESLLPEVERMKEKIATEGYTEEEIEDFLHAYQNYKKEGRRAEAAQVLLLAAATESKFAQFLLARELFRGEVIQKDHAESFTQINTLADQNFAEAICDLGQFYEYGIGIGKDREMALLLYEEAAELGVARARKHYERLKNSRGIKGLLGKVKVPLKLPKKTKE